MSRRRWLFDRKLRHSFADLVSSSSGIHMHGLWEQSTMAAAHAAHQYRIPYIVSAHGMLEPWALQQRAMKKRIYAACVERRMLNNATCLHALTRTEAEDFRRFGCTSPIAVIPNGVNVPDHVLPDLFLRKYNQLLGKRIILFLGRLHEKKGLDLLIDSWPEIARRYPEARLVVAGPDFEGSLERLATKVAALSVPDTVLFSGMLRDEMKWSALAASEAYILPSFSEGLSMSVLEAMGSGLPVLISTQCNLPEVETLGAGHIISPVVSSIKKALISLLERSPKMNASMGARGRAYVLQSFNWASISSDMVSVYRWISRGGTPPSIVEQSSSVTSKRAPR